MRSVCFSALWGIESRTWRPHQTRAAFPALQLGTAESQNLGELPTNLDYFDKGEVSRSLESLGTAEGIEAVAHHANSLVFSCCSRAAEVLQTTDERCDLCCRDQGFQERCAIASRKRDDRSILAVETGRSNEPHRSHIGSPFRLCIRAKMGYRFLAPHNLYAVARS